MHSSAAKPEMNWDAPEIAALVRAALHEDIGAGDATAQALVPPTATARARIIAKQEVIVAGLPLAAQVFRALDAAIAFTARQHEGAALRKGDLLAEISGSAAAILSGERTALNFLAHLCGIATQTRRFVEALAGTRTRIRDTRKTTPLLRALEKYAVRTGGGTNHRFGLYDAILIKENHIAMAGGVKPAMDRAHAFAARTSPAAREMTAYEAYRSPEIAACFRFKSRCATRRSFARRCIAAQKQCFWTTKQQWKQRAWYPLRAGFARIA